MRSTIRPWRSVLISAVALSVLPASAASQRLEADSAEAYYREGVELLARGEARVPSPWGILDGLTIWEDVLRLIGRDGTSRAREAFRRAVALDSAHAGAAVGLARLAVASGEAEALREAEAALEAAASTGSPSPEVWLWRARVATALGDPAAAEHAARYREAGGEAALGFLAEARAHFAAGRDSAGGAAYFAGVGVLTMEAAERYHADLGPLVRPAEATAWEDPGGAAARADWLRRFWARRAAEAGVGVAERIGEHYRRLRVASERYRRTSRRETMVADVRAIPHGARDYGLDDRGVIYLLHGEPDTVVSTPDSELLPNESWLYRHPEGARILHFVALGRAGEFVLVADPLAAFEASPIPACSTLPCPSVDPAVALLEDRAALDPRYALLANRLRTAATSGSSPADLQADLRQARGSMAAEMTGFATAALARDSHAVGFDAPLPFYYDTYGFRGEGGRTDLVVALAVPGEKLRPMPVEGGVAYPLELSLLLVDTLRGTAFEVDSARAFRAPAPLTEGENLRAILQLEAEPGDDYVHRVRLTAAGGTSAGASYGGPLEVRDFRGDTLMVSDLVLAEAEGTGWARGRVELGLVPPRRFERGGAVSLFYELYNIAPETAYRTTIRAEPLRGPGLWGRIRRLFGGDPAPLALSFEAVADAPEDGTEQVVRRLDLGTLRPGAYRLVVTTRVGDRALRREVEFAILEDG